MPKKFSVLSAPRETDPHRLEQVDQQKCAIVTALKPDRLREYHAMTRRILAEKMEVSQANVSRIEHGEDLSISMLRAYVEAWGGRLALRAIVEDGVIDIAPDGVYAVSSQHITRTAHDH